VIEFAEDLFIQEADVRFYGVRLQTRMTILRLSDDRLFLHSPTFLEAGLRRELDRLGEVRFVVSPNKIHNQAIPQYLEAYPEAAFLAPPGLPERRPQLRFSGVLGDEPHPGWAGAIEQIATRGNVFFSEVLFFHLASRTLIVGDLVENLDAGTTSRVGLRLAKLFGVPPRPVASPEFRLYTTDADAAAESFQRVLQWDFERIVIAHGALIEENARETFRTVCDELVEGVRRRRPIIKRFFTRMASIQ